MSNKLHGSNHTRASRTRKIGVAELTPSQPKQELSVSLRAHAYGKNQKNGKKEKEKENICGVEHAYLKKGKTSKFHLRAWRQF